MRRVALSLALFAVVSLSFAWTTPANLAVQATVSAAADSVPGANTPLDIASPDCRLVTIAKGERSGWSLNTGFLGADLVIRDPAAWGYFWQVHVGSTTPVPPPPIDFQTQVVIAAIQGTQSSGGGPNIAITELGARGPIVTIRVFDDRRPGPIDVITNPFHIVVVPRTCLPPEASFAFEHAAPVAGTSVVTGHVLGARPDAATPPIPLAGAHVRLVVTNTLTREMYTGLDGSFFFVNVQPGTYPLSAEAAGFAPATFTLPVPASALVGHDFVLQPLPPTNGSITGHTAQPDPSTNGLAPLPGTLVELRKADQTILQTTSGPDGAYALPQVAPDAYVLRASHDGFITQAIPVTVAAGQSIVQDFVLQPSTTTPGSISGHTAHPEQGALVPLANTLVELRKADQTIQQTTSGQDGAYAFPEVAPGAYVLRASHEGFVPLAIPVVVGPGQVVVQDFVLMPPPPPPTTSGIFRGHVRGATSSGTPGPLPQALVRLFKASSNDVRQVRTDPLGLFVMLDVPPGHYTATAQKDGWQPVSAEIDIVAGQTTEHDFLLVPAPPVVTNTGK